MSIELMKREFLDRLHERLHHYLYVDPKEDPEDKSMSETYELIEMGHISMNEILDEIRMALEDEFPDLIRRVVVDGEIVGDQISTTASFDPPVVIGVNQRLRISDDNKTYILYEVGTDKTISTGKIIPAGSYG